METIENLAPERVASEPVPQAESSEFELKMLDCGTNYEVGDTLPTCLSCFCGAGCFCGSVSE